MEYVNFGTAGLRVSRIALGMGLRGQADEAQVERLIHKALESGINLFDCANVYGLMDDRVYAGRSEEILGRALKGRRDDVVITSKVFGAIGARPNDQGASRYHILREVERSLRRLATDRIDVYLLHGFDAATPLDEQFRTLEQLVQQGKIRYVGVCNYQAWQVVRAVWVQDRLNAAPLITVQNPYSLLNRGLEAEMFPMARALGLGIMAYAPLGTGLLSGAYAVGGAPPPDTLWGSRRRDQFSQTLRGRPADVLTAVRDVAERSGATVAQVALRWVLAQQEITVAISGADNEQQIEENAAATSAPLTAEDLQQLTEASAGLSISLDGPQFG